MRLRLSFGMVLPAALVVTVCACSGGPSTASQSPTPVQPSASPAGGALTPTSSTTANLPSTGSATALSSKAAGTSPETSPSTTAAAAGASPWPGYHSNPARTGAVAAVASLSQATRAWSADLGGPVRGQPLAVGDRIIAATENNRIVALDRSGGVLWSRSVGTPLTNVDQVAGCGDVDPLGITSTMVADPATGVVYAVAEVSDGSGSVHHQLFGLSVSSGATVLSANADPPLPQGETSVHLLQRAGLALGNGRVYIGFGGNDGDCGSYHGWLVGMKETSPVDKISFEVSPDGEGGAIWQSGGAPALDTAGNVYVTTGNANPDPPEGGPDPKKYTESVVKLAPDLKPLASFKDTVAGGDEDLSTGNAVLLPGGLVFSVGKTDIGYLLTQATLTRVAAVTGICGSNPDGGPAFDPVTQRLFVPCRGGGIQVVDVAHRKLDPRLPGADSAPIVVGAGVWSLDHTEGTLSEFDTSSGQKKQTVKVGAEVPIFSSPSVGLGLLLVATTVGVAAFR